MKWNDMPSPSQTTFVALSKTTCFGPQAQPLILTMLQDPHEPPAPEAGLHAQQNLSVEPVTKPAVGRPSFPVGEHQQQQDEDEAAGSGDYDDDEEEEEAVVDPPGRRRSGSDCATAGVAGRMNLVSHFQGSERQGHALMSSALNDASRTVIDVQAVVYDAWKAAQAAVEAHAKVLERVRTLEKDDAFGPILNQLEDHLRKIVEQGIQAEKAVKALVRVGRNYGTSFAQAFKDVKRREIETTKLELALNHSHEFMKQLKDECTRVQFDMSRIKSVSQDFEFKARLKRGRRELMRQADKYECLNQRYQGKFSEFCTSAERFLCHNARQLIGLIVGLLTTLETHHKDLANCHATAAAILTRKSPEALLAEYAESVDIDLQNNEMPLTDSECLSLENLVEDSNAMTMAAWEKAYDSERNSPAALSRSKVTSPKASAETTRRLSHVPSAPINVIYQQNQQPLAAGGQAGFPASPGAPCVENYAGGVMTIIAPGGGLTNNNGPAVGNVDLIGGGGPAENGKNGINPTESALSAKPTPSATAQQTPTTQSPKDLNVNLPSETPKEQSASPSPKPEQDPPGTPQEPTEPSTPQGLKISTDIVLEYNSGSPSGSASPASNNDASIPPSPDGQEGSALESRPGAGQDACNSPASACRNRSGGCAAVGQLCDTTIGDLLHMKAHVGHQHHCHSRKAPKEYPERKLNRKNSSLVFINNMQRKDKMMVRGPSRNASRARDYMYPFFDFDPDEEDLMVTSGVVKTKPGSVYSQGRRKLIGERREIRRDSGNDYLAQSCIEYDYLPQMFPAGFPGGYQMKARPRSQPRQQLMDLKRKTKQGYTPSVSFSSDRICYDEQRGHKHYKNGIHVQNPASDGPEVQISNEVCQETCRTEPFQCCTVDPNLSNPCVHEKTGEVTHAKENPDFPKAADGDKETAVCVKETFEGTSKDLAKQGSEESVSGNVLRTIIREELDNVLDKLKYKSKEKSSGKSSRRQVRVSVCAENILEACLDVNSSKSRSSSTPDCTASVLAPGGTEAIPEKETTQNKAQWVFSRDSKSLVITGTLDGSGSKESKFLRLVNLPADHKPITNGEQNTLAEGDTAGEVLHLPAGQDVAVDDLPPAQEPHQDLEKGCDDNLRHVIKEELESLLNILKEQVKKRFNVSERSESERHVAFNINSCEGNSAKAADSGSFDAMPAKDSHPSFPILQESTKEDNQNSISSQESRADLSKASRVPENSEQIPPNPPPRKQSFCSNKMHTKPTRPPSKPKSLWWDETSSLNSVPIVGTNGGHPVVSSFKLALPPLSAEGYSDNVSMTSTKRPSVSSTDDEFSITDGCLPGVAFPSVASLSVPMIDSNDTIPIIANIKEVFSRSRDGKDGEFECLGSIVLSLSSELSDLFKEESNNPEATLKFKLFKNSCKKYPWPGIQIAEGIVEPMSVVFGEGQEDDAKSPALAFSLNMKALSEYLGVVAKLQSPGNHLTGLQVARYRIASSGLNNWLPITLEQHWEKLKPKVLQCVIGTKTSAVGFAKLPGPDAGTYIISIHFTGKVCGVVDEPSNHSRCELDDSGKKLSWQLDFEDQQPVIAATLTLGTSSAKPKFCEVEFQWPEASVAGMDIDLMNPAYSLWDKRRAVATLNYSFPCPNASTADSSAQLLNQSSVKTMAGVEDIETSIDV